MAALLQGATDDAVWTAYLSFQVSSAHLLVIVICGRLALTVLTLAALLQFRRR
jgi:hypothetical protein